MITNTTARRPRQTIALLVGTASLLSLSVFFFSETISSAYVRYASRAHDYIDSTSVAQTYFSSSKSHPGKNRIYDCLDPYRQPGYYHVDPADYRNSQWLPIDHDFLDLPDPESALYPRPSSPDDLFFDDAEPPAEILDSPSAPKQWLRHAVIEAARRADAVKDAAKDTAELGYVHADHFTPYKDDANLGWLWGRRLLVLGDSVDRFLATYFCAEFGHFGHLGGLGQRTTFSCHIPELNFTLTQWHYAGSWTYRPDWWWMEDMELVALEERWEEYYLPNITKEVAGRDGKNPDVIMWQNGLWDQRALWEAGEARFGKGSENETNYVMGFRERKLQFGEVRFVVARLKKLVAMLEDQFPGAPKMFRAISMHRISNATDANLYELDRIGRAVATRAGHEVFEWGRLVSANAWMYRDQVHPDRGPAGWLFGTMALEYVARAAGVGGSPYFEGWDKCHEANVGWGGR